MVTKRGRTPRSAEELASALRQYWKDHPHSWDNLLVDEATVDAVRGGEGQLGISIGCTAPVCDQADQGDETDTLVVPGASKETVEKLKDLYRKELAGEQVGFADPGELPDVPGAKKHASQDGVVLK